MPDKPTMIILDLLSQNYYKGRKIVMLFNEKVPISALTVLRSMANKVGYAKSDIKFFSFDRKKRGMLEINLGNKYFEFSTDQNVYIDIWEQNKN